MKKMLAILMALLMAALLLPAYAEEGDVAEIAEIAGTVLEIGEECILLETPEGQLIEAILTADTIREGKEIAEGDFIHVMYNGQMTRSYPAQVTAQHIGCYVLTGTVSDITDEGFTLTTDETTYIVHATAEQLAQITDGAEINVYFSGVIAMSLRRADYRGGEGSRPYRHGRRGVHHHGNRGWSADSGQPDLPDAAAGWHSGLGRDGSRDLQWADDQLHPRAGDGGYD